MVAQLLMEPMHQVLIQHARRESTHQVLLIPPFIQLLLLLIYLLIPGLRSSWRSMKAS